VSGRRTIHLSALAVLIFLGEGLTPSIAHAGDPTSNKNEPPSSGTEAWKPQPSISPQSLIGLRGASSSASGDPNSLGLGVASHTAAYYTLYVFTTRVSSAGAIGGSRHGTEGLWAADVAIGALLPLGIGHGPFARIGARGYMFGNQVAWLSNIEAPAGYVGYQYLRGPWLLEAAGRAGLVIDGRQTHYGRLMGFDVLQRRKVGGDAEYGGHVAVGYGMFLLEAEYMRIAVSDALGTPLTALTGSLCIRPGTFGACADYRSWSADVHHVDGLREFTVGYGGISFGVWTP
jgi:hypothetical protein